MKSMVNSGGLPEVMRAGDCISVDQLESPLPGFFPQMKECLTRPRYQVATVFVNHCSRLGYIHLHYSATSENMLKAKRNFESLL